MRLLIKQRVFSWTDSFDIYDENGNVRYYVKTEFFSLGHQMHVYDAGNREIGTVRQKLLTFVPTFDIEMGGTYRGRIQKKITFLRPKYDVDFNGWSVEGDFLEWEYDVYAGGGPIIHISKEIFHWGDTYVINIANPSDELMGVMLVLAIDAANCTDGN